MTSKHILITICTLATMASIFAICAVVDRGIDIRVKLTLGIDPVLLKPSVVSKLGQPKR
jgi:hypothetical protein